MNIHLNDFSFTQHYAGSNSSFLIISSIRFSSIPATPETELIDKEYRTKTSLSEHGIEIYNTGKNPFILESFELCYKNKLLVDCHIVENAKVLMPSESFTYTLMEQEADALQHHCNQEKFETCDVTAYSVEGKKIKTKLWVPLFYIRAGR